MKCRWRPSASAVAARGPRDRGCRNDNDQSREAPRIRTPRCLLKLVHGAVSTESESLDFELESIFESAHDFVDWGLADRGWNRFGNAECILGTNVVRGNQLGENPQAQELNSDKQERN